MNIAFSVYPIFNEMTDTSANISQVLYNYFLNVNEKGTEAAAVTAIKIKTTSSIKIAPPKLFKMIIDHPFFVK